MDRPDFFFLFWFASQAFYVNTLWTKLAWYYRQLYYCGWREMYRTFESCTYVAVEVVLGVLLHCCMLMTVAFVSYYSVAFADHLNSTTCK